MAKGRYELKPPATSAEWESYHRIRREVLYEARGRVNLYDPNLPDEHAEGRTPLLLFHDAKPVATVRLDPLSDGSMITRLVAVEAAEQRSGHGRELLRLAEVRAIAAGARRMAVNAHVDAETFYAKSGYRRESWDDPWDGRADVDDVQMVKDL